MNMINEQLISPFNLMELIVVLKYEILQDLQTKPETQVMGWVDPILNELALDNSFLANRYFDKHLPREAIVS